LKEPAAHSDRQPQHRRKIFGLEYPVRSVTHSEPAAASATTQIAADARLLSHTARPIIKLREANAVNQVRSMSASQPLVEVASAISVALKMPEIIVSQAARSTAKHGVDRRQTQPRHRIDQSRFLHDRRSRRRARLPHRRFREDRRGRKKRDQSRCSERPNRNILAGFDFARRARLR